MVNDPRQAICPKKERFLCQSDNWSIILFYLVSVPIPSEQCLAGLLGNFTETTNSLTATPTPAIFKAEFSWSPLVQTANAFQEQVQLFQNPDHKLNASSAKVQEQEGQIYCWSTGTYEGSWETPVCLLTIIQNILHVAVTWPSCCCSFISWVISNSNLFLTWVISSINLLLLILLTFYIAPWKSLGSVGPTVELPHPWNIPLCSGDSSLE